MCGQRAADTGQSVKCGIVKRRKEIHKDKEIRKEIHKDKEIRFEKPSFDKRPEKPLTDKSIGLDKGFDKRLDKPRDGKRGEKPGEGGGLGGGLGGGRTSGVDGQYLQERVAQLEAIVGELLTGGGGYGIDPFIGSELRPDLSQGALSDEEGMVHPGAATDKRWLDTKGSDV